MRGASSAPQALAAAGGAGGVYVPLSTGSPMAAAGAGAAAQAPASSAPLPASAPLAKFKVVFLGDSGAGKTSLIKTFIYGPGQFEANYSATIGIDFLAKVRGKESSGRFLNLTTQCSRKLPLPRLPHFASLHPVPLARARAPDHFSRGPHGAAADLGLGGAGALPLAHPFVHPRRALCPARRARSAPLAPKALARADASSETLSPCVPAHFASQSSVAIVVYDTTSRPSFVNAGRWIEDVRAERGR
jgi:hypothetical protein